MKRLSTLPRSFALATLAALLGACMDPGAAASAESSAQITADGGAAPSGDAGPCSTTPPEDAGHGAGAFAGAYYGRFERVQVRGANPPSADEGHLRVRITDGAPPDGMTVAVSWMDGQPLVTLAAQRDGASATFTPGQTFPHGGVTYTLGASSIALVGSELSLDFRIDGPDGYTRFHGTAPREE